ncbi:MAG: phytanoyl-CoA dioxygenase family protein [Actinomycetota bacterium]
MAASTRTLRVLTPEQVDRYRRDGYLLLPGLIDDDRLHRLRAASDEFVERSRSLTASSAAIDVESDHSAAAPRLRRLTSPPDHHPDFAEFTLAGPAADIAVDLLGDPARFHHAKLNYKWSGGGAAVDWHQDIQYWPHTDFTPLTIGVYLSDVDDEMGPMGIIPGSHRGELFPLRGDPDADGNRPWTGSIGPGDLATVALDTVDWLRGPAGSVTVHNCGSIHGSMPNTSTRPRPLLLQTYSAADSFPLLGVGTNGKDGRYRGVLVGDGGPPATITVQGRSIPAAPDWSRGGYTTIFDIQSADDTAEGAPDAADDTAEGAPDAADDTAEGAPDAGDGGAEGGAAGDGAGPAGGATSGGIRSVGRGPR